MTGMMQAILRTAFPLPAGRARPFTWPWQDRAGRLSTLRAVVFALLMVPAAWVAGEAALGLLGRSPGRRRCAKSASGPSGCCW